MKQLVIALFALISVNVSAQTLYDRVEEIIVKPLEDCNCGLMITRGESNYYHNRKTIGFAIPLMKSTDGNGRSEQENAAIRRQAEKYNHAYELLLQGLQKLRQDAFESYWWEKNSLDSLMISMSWNPEKGNKTYTSVVPNAPKVFGADFIQVSKMVYGTSDSPFAPRCLVVFDFTYTTDSAIVGTKPLDIQGFKKFVEPVFKKKGITHRTFSYRYSKDYLEKHPDTPRFLDKNISDHVADNGDVYFIPKKMTSQFVEDFKALIHSYIDSHREEACGFSNFSSNAGWIPALQNDVVYEANEKSSEKYARHGSDSNNPLFTVWIDSSQGDGLTVVMSNSYGGINFRNDYRKYRTINDDKKEEY